MSRRKLWMAAAVGLVLMPSLVASAMKDTESNEAAIARNLSIFNSLYKELSMSYVDTINADKTMTTAINAMLEELDPYTEYIKAEDREDFMTISTGEYGGIGSYIMQSKGGVFISSPYEGSPAAEAGLRPGDRIIMINNDSTVKWTSSQVSAKLKGQANTVVKVVVDRPYVADSILTFNITRRKIQMPSVPYWTVKYGSVGYIQLTTFNENSPEEVRTALEALKKNPAVKSIVLDLRGNGGGILESAVQIINFFVPKNTVVLRQKGRLKQEEKVYKTTQKPVDTKIPLAVLVDGGTASSSEIVTGALQDLDRAIVVGSRSFGKGLVQSTRPLPYDNMLKVTIAKYYLPSGRLIQAIDYSHRNPDGSVGRIPDSLTTVFKTAGGREVRDGGGITPDVTVDWGKMNRLTYNIMRDNWAFDFATKYAAEHPKIAAPEDFVITDSIFNAFKRFIDPKRFNYDKVCETGLSELRKTAEAEGYMNDSTKQAFDALEHLLRHNLQQDLNHNRKEISEMLASEILSRYYYQRGSIIESLKHDVAMDTVQKIFANPAEYRKLLSPKAAATTGGKKASKK